jgi:hypothetical protein
MTGAAKMVSTNKGVTQDGTGEVTPWPGGILCFVSWVFSTGVITVHLRVDPTMDYTRVAGGTCRRHDPRTSNIMHALNIHVGARLTHHERIPDLSKREVQNLRDGVSCDL